MVILNALLYCVQLMIEDTFMEGCCVRLGGGSKIGKLMKQKQTPKSTLLADNTQGLITTKQTKSRSLLHRIPSYSRILKLRNNHEANPKTQTIKSREEHNIQKTTLLQLKDPKVHEKNADRDIT